MSTVLVTGAAQRLGKNLALYLASRGHDLVVHYNTSTAAAIELQQIITEQYQRQCWLVTADFANSAAVAAVFQNLSTRNITVDILINSASVFLPDTFQNVEYTTLQHQSMINYIAPLLLMQAFITQAQNGSQIINITDTCNYMLRGNYVSYALSKVALEHATLLAAQELAPKIRVNAIAPGRIIFNNNDSNIINDNIDNIAMDTACFTRTLDLLLQHKHLTGQIIHLDNGLHLK